MAGVAGAGSGFLVIAAIELVAHAVYAPGVMPDISTPEAMAAYVGSMPLGAFLFVLAAYVAGTVVGGFVGIAIARRHAMRFAGLAGGLILLASIANFVAVPHPTWFVVATLVDVPLAAWLTGRVGRAWAPEAGVLRKSPRLTGQAVRRTCGDPRIGVKGKDTPSKGSMRHRNRPIPGADDRYLHERCKVAPSPEAQERLKAKLQEAADRAGLSAGQVGLVPLDRGGYNDGLIKPGTDLPLGTPLRVARRGALERAPLRGQVRVLVVLVDFSDRAMTATPQHFEDLFFSTGKLPHGSVREYLKEASGNKITITGEVVGPFRMPLPLATYGGGGSGTEIRRRTRGRWPARRRCRPTRSSTTSRTTTTATASSTRSSSSTPAAAPRRRSTERHLVAQVGVRRRRAQRRRHQGVRLPDRARGQQIGVCAHELGHLLFGWPNLYDTDESSSGLGNWCLMAGGSWNGDGDIPAHPSAWCKS